jgi:hypothetical protein
MYQLLRTNMGASPTVEQVSDFLISLGVEHGSPHSLTLTFPPYSNADTFLLNNTMILQKMLIFEENLVVQNSYRTRHYTSDIPESC